MRSMVEGHVRDRVPFRRQEYTPAPLPTPAYGGGPPTLAGEERKKSPEAQKTIFLHEPLWLSDFGSPPESGTIPCPCSTRS